jgi:predicted alpha-1,2-mannosidase
MISRSKHVVSAAVCGWAAFLASACVFAADPAPVDSVRPMIGTAEHGHVYPGATVPFGMVQLSPDTRLDTWDGCSGYHYSDKTILGFSHTHLTGTGCADLGDVRVQPIRGEIPPKKGYGRPQAFSHDDEIAKPGYYSVTFTDPKIKAELTATAHAGFHRYTIPQGETPRLLIDLGNGIASDPVEGQFVVEKDTVISGYRRSHGWAADKTFYFVAEFSRPFKSHGFLKNDQPLPAGLKEAKAQWLVAHFDFEDNDKPILMKIGISAVSVDAARNNLAAEIPGMDFDGTAAAAKKCWSDVLDKIEIKTGDPAVRETFYTALYHACLAPTLFNDADGGYRGLDHKIHPAEGFQNYCTFSLWDTFRAEHPLLTIIQPQRVDDFIGSMLAHYRQFGQHSTPIWSLAGNETWCMIGYHSIPVIVDAYKKGFRRYDVEAIYQAMRDTAMQDRNELKEYREKGYIPSAEGKQSVSRTLEYAYDDWCIAQMAKMLGKEEDAVLFSKRAENYRNLFDPSVGFMRGKLADGKWREPFDPRQLVWEDYTEATSWNYTWFVPQNVASLIELMGGDEKFIAKLDQMFAEKSGLLANIPDLTGLIGQYVHGNEPCHHVAYLYNDAGASWKTQERIRNVMTTLYNNKPDGICGNDDCGQTSAWYVLSALGFYPVNPASGVYAIGSPMVDKATIHLDPKYFKGKEFTIVAENNSPKNVYIQSATLNGKPLTRSWFTHDELAAGGELLLKMGPEPNRQWAQSVKDRPSAVQSSE